MIGTLSRDAEVRASTSEDGATVRTRTECQPRWLVVSLDSDTRISRIILGESPAQTSFSTQGLQLNLSDFALHTLTVT